MLKTDTFGLELQFRSEEDQRKFVETVRAYVIHTNLEQSYKIIKKLDKGGFGTVFKAKKKISEELVALKKVDKSKIKSIKNYVIGPKKVLFMEKEQKGKEKAA